VAYGSWKLSLESAFDFANGALTYRTDLSKGPMFGRTITTDVGTGNIIVALLAVLTTLGTYPLLPPLLFCYDCMESQLNLTDHL
jgi:hypothetical protein